MRLPLFWLSLHQGCRDRSRRWATCSWVRKSPRCSEYFRPSAMPEPKLYAFSTHIGTARDNCKER
jgi:hypothetical protein